MTKVHDWGSNRVRRIILDSRTQREAAAMLGVTPTRIRQKMPELGVRGLRWENGNKINHTLRAVVLDHVDRRVPKQFGEIRDAVVNDYGAISNRQIYRIIDVLLTLGYLKRTRSDFGFSYEYLRTDKSFELDGVRADIRNEL